MDDLRIALICMQSVLGEVDRNLERIAALAGKAAQKGAQLVCFPEFAATGYALKTPERYCTVDDTERIIGRLTDLSRKTGLLLAVGLIERSAQNEMFISQALAGPSGFVGMYRKTHLSPAEKGVYRAGEKLGAFHWNDWTIGMQLCYEAHFPEISTAMALQGADLLLMPHASPRGTPREKLDSWMRHMTARAFDNGVFVAACNQTGENGRGLTFPGAALALGPDGRFLKCFQGEGEAILTANLRKKTLREVREHRMKYFLPQRRPELYEGIAKASSSMNRFADDC